MTMIKSQMGPAAQFSMTGQGLNKLLCQLLLLEFIHNVKNRAFTIEAELCGPFNPKLIETNKMSHVNRDLSVMQEKNTKICVRGREKRDTISILH